MDKDTIKLIVAGSRDFDNFEFMNKVLNEFKESNKNKRIILVSGTAKGADSLGIKWAEKNGLEIIRFVPNWSVEGRAAGPIRNRQMAEYSDCLLAFWDGKSKGTKNMIECMEKLKKEYFIYNTGNIRELFVEI